jgi:hypothetical protein
MDLTEDEFAETLHSFEHTAFRLELQLAYAEPTERDTLAKFAAGEPEPPTEVPILRHWYERVRGHTQLGKSINRVRVHEDPPTGYQQWERWIGAWNSDAGEVIRYMTRQKAFEIGLLPAAGDRDWWLLDSNRLIVMHFDESGYRYRNSLVTDPAAISQACAWRDLAVQNSAPDRNRDASPSARST